MGAVAQHDYAVIVFYGAVESLVEIGALAETDGNEAFDVVAAQVVVDVGFVETRSLALGEVGLVGQGLDGGGVIGFDRGAGGSGAGGGVWIAPAGAVDFALDAARLVD